MRLVVLSLELKNTANSHSAIFSSILKTIAMLTAENINIFELNILKIGKICDHAKHMHIITVINHLKMSYQYLFKRLLFLVDKQY